MRAGRPHEAAGNGSPRWMTAASRKRGTEPGLQAGSPPIMSLTWDGMVTALLDSVPAATAPPSSDPGHHAILAVEGILGPHEDEADVPWVLIVARGFAAHRP